MSPRANEIWAIEDIFAISTMVGSKQPKLGCELRASPVVLARSASTSTFFHPRCRCKCKILTQSPWHNSNMDELFCKRCKIPYISSSYARSLLLAKGQRTLLLKQLGLINNWLRFNSHTNSIDDPAKFEKQPADVWGAQ
jgi:hypothetical protein